MSGITTAQKAFKALRRAEGVLSECINACSRPDITPSQIAATLIEELRKIRVLLKGSERKDADTWRDYAERNLKWAEKLNAKQMNRQGALRALEAVETALDEIEAVEGTLKESDFELWKRAQKLLNKKECCV